MTEEPRASLEFFGQFLSENLRDQAMQHFDGWSRGQWKAPSLQQLQDLFRELSDEQKQIVRRAVLCVLDSGIHDFLFKLQEQADFENRIAITVDGNDIIAESDGLHGEMFSEEGWFAKYSREGQPPDVY